MEDREQRRASPRMTAERKRHVQGPRSTARPVPLCLGGAPPREAAAGGHREGTSTAEGRCSSRRSGAAEGRLSLHPPGENESRKGREGGRKREPRPAGAATVGAVEAAEGGRERVGR